MAFSVLNTGFPRINRALALVVATVVLNAGLSYFLIQRSKSGIAEMTGKISPYVDALSELNLMVNESKMYSTNWVYLQNNVEDKESLRALHHRRYPVLREKLQHLSALRGKKEDVKDLARVFGKFRQLIDIETQIMSTLTVFDDYENPQKKFECEELIESEVLPRSAELIALVGSIMTRNKQEAARLATEIAAGAKQMMTIISLCSIGLLVIMLFAAAFISGGIRQPVTRMKEIVLRMARGQQVRDRLEGGSDVVGEMVSAVNALSDSFTQTSAFANEIERGNLEVPYEKLSNDDVLGEALIQMRESLKAYSNDMEARVRQRTEEVIEKTRKLEHAYKEIRDSINYARRIQESILPSTEMIRQAFPECFIFYRPKDVVCGDFYWFGKRGRETVIAAIDCTGHGVPGALMTVIGNSLLNQIVTHSGVTSPAEILRQLDSKLHDTLKQHGGNVTSDGMDMAVCHYTEGDRKVTFAGARRPLYLMRGEKLSEFKGSKAPIGSYIAGFQKNFTEHQVPVHRHDTLYMFSDGVQDQFGGLEGKKFMISRLRGLLLSVQSLAMTAQQLTIESEMDAWQGDHEQTDDMLLIGIRF
jgi:serine phosphatase RsbU (regulator of sigma subunit)